MATKTTTKVTDLELAEMEKETAKTVNAEGKIRIKLPLDKLNKEDLIVPVIINGHTWAIERGKSVEVPEQVALILEEAGYI